MQKEKDGHYKTAAGLIVVADAVESDRARQVYGTLVAIGPRAWHDDGGPEGWGVKVGDRVTYAKYGGAFVEGPDGERLIVLNDEDIICKVK